VTPRRFPPPWSIEELEACFVVRDHSSQALAYVYFEDRRFRDLGRAVFLAVRDLGRAALISWTTCLFSGR
jgi:hypothetical protein